MLPRKRYAAKAGKLVSVLSPFVTSRSWMRGIPPCEGRKAKQSRILQSASCFRALYRLQANLSFTKVQVREALQTIAGSSSWATTIPNHRTWADENAKILRSNCSHVGKAIRDERGWAKTVTSAATLPAMMDAASRDRKLVRVGTEDTTVDANVDGNPLEGEEEEECVLESLESEAEAEAAAPAAASSDQGRPAAAAAQAAASDAVAVAPAAKPAPAKEYLYGWLHDIGQAFRAELINGKAGQKQISNCLAHSKPFDPSSFIVAIWNEPDGTEHEMDITEMPMGVYMSRYDGSWCTDNDEPLVMPMVVPEVPQFVPESGAAVPKAAAEPGSAGPLVPTPKAAAIARAKMFTTSTPEGQPISLQAKIQKGRTDLWVIKIDGAQVLQTPKTDIGHSCMTKIVTMLASGEVLEPKNGHLNLSQGT
jgi:hypothetical protein